MPIVRIRREEMETVTEAAERMARRSNSRFVVDRSRVEVTDADDQAGAQRQNERREALSFR